MSGQTLYLAPRALVPGALARLAPPLPAELRAPAALADRVADWTNRFPVTPSSAAGTAARLFPRTSAQTFSGWLTIRSAIGAPEEAQEPLLHPDPERCALFPLRDEEMFQFRKTLERLHWVAQEVDLSQDAADLSKVSAEDRRLLWETLAFFGIADELVMDQIDGTLSDLVQIKEGQYYLRAQSDQECVHSEAYSLQIQEIVPAEKRAEIFEAVKTVPAVGAMADWVRWWTLGVHPAADTFAAMAFIEGVMFSGFFAVLQHYKVLNLFPGVTTLNEFIARDEGVHTLFWCFLVKERLLKRPETAVVAAIARETVRLCEAFFGAAIPSEIVGINAALLGQYVRFVADTVLAQLGYPAAFGEENPFSFMDSLALNEVAKSNFFETRASQYQNLGTEGALRFEVDRSPIDGA